jgi:SAM-dependent methyltransferase
VGVVTAEQALMETQRAFDRVAPGYDLSNARNPILCAMRARTRETLERVVPAGARILDLGCGPGTDEVPLARRGYYVTAIDWSAAMVGEARRRVEEAGVGARARIHHLGIHQLEALSPDVFDAAYSSFGPLNCVDDLPAAARGIARRLRPGGVLVASVIGRVCPWEIAMYALRGDWSRAVLRLTRRRVAVPLEGRTVWTRYYAPREFSRVFAAAGFMPVALRALGLLAPPPYLEGLAARRPRLVARLNRIDDTVGAWPVARSWGDHFLIVLRRT